MKFWLGVAVTALGVAFGAYYATLYAVPYWEMRKAEAKIAARAGGINVMFHAPRPTAKSRVVVRPSPDQLYSVCIYDLSAGPIRFSGQIPDTYWSLSLFAQNTDNFFVVNDNEVDGPEYNFVLIRNGDRAPPDVAPANIIRSPTTRGIALVRVFIDDDAHVASIDKIRRQGTCSVLTDKN